jgi:hypothetical protein
MSLKEPTLEEAKEAMRKMTQLIATPLSYFQQNKKKEFYPIYGLFLAIGMILGEIGARLNRIE